MKHLTIMQITMNVVIVSNGICLAAWIFSKAVLNVVKAGNLWVSFKVCEADIPEKVSPEYKDWKKDVAETFKAL